MPIDDKREAALELLAEVLGDERARRSLAHVLHQLMETEDGEPIPVYAGTSEEGYGSFVCEFMPLAAVERLMAECEIIFDDFEVVGSEGHSAKIAGMKVPQEYRAEMVKNMARLAVHNLLTNAREKLTAAFWLNFEESKAVARGALAVMLTNLYELANIPATPDVRADVAELRKKAGDEEGHHAARLLRRYGRLVVEAQRGRPRKVTTPRALAMLRKHGKVTAEKMAELLSCDVSAVKDWARSTEWKTWSAARTALLDQAKKGGN